MTQQLSDVNNSLTASKQIKGSKECYLLGQKHKLQIFGDNPLYQATKRHLTVKHKTMKNEMKSSITYLFLFRTLAVILVSDFSLSLTASSAKAPDNVGEQLPQTVNNLWNETSDSQRLVE